MLEDIMDNVSQLWVEEKELLFDFAKIVPPEGVIVEIGTAQGGSSEIFYNATKDKSIEIWSYDIAPSKEAYDKLQGTTVNIVPKSSEEGALLWAKNKPIDLLFIDGSHTLKDLFNDYNLWVSYLKPNGMVVFHDYDPPLRGGIVHLGVRVAVDTVLRLGFLENPIHNYRLLSGRVKNNALKLTTQHCKETFNALLNRVISISENEQVSDKILINYIKSVATEFNGQITDLDAGYILYFGLKNNREEILQLSKNRKGFFEWEEVLQMFEHALSDDSLKNIDYLEDIDVNKLSAQVSIEQVRLKIITMLFKTIMI
jgi:hypothetical protein